MIKSFHFRNYIGFKDIKSPDLSDSITVVIGKNDTGKTNLLKMLYGICRSVQDYSQNTQKTSLKQALSAKLLNVFLTDKNELGQLVKKPNTDKLTIDVEFSQERVKYQDRIHFSFSDSTTNTIVDCTDNISHMLNESTGFIFIPAKEVLSALATIRASRDNYQLTGFDDTYLDLIRSLTLPGRSGKINKDLYSVISDLKKTFDGEVEKKKNDQFVFKRGKTEFKMNYTAEGIKKMGILTTLIRNRELNTNTVLFMDEPENAMHPGALRTFVKHLIAMNKAGVQIFLTTHNYFVINQLQIEAKKKEAKINCCSIEREEGELKARFYDMANEIPENSIINEALAMFDEDIKETL